MPDPLSCFIVAGGWNAALNIATEPADRVRMRFTNQDFDPRVLSGEVRRVGLPHKMFWRMVKEDGVRAALPSATRVVQRSAILMDGLRFGCKELYESLLPKRYKRSEYTRFCFYQYLAGGLAGLTSHTIHYPFGQHTRITGIAATEFLSYKNFRFSATPVVVYNAMYFGTFEAAKAYRPQRRRWEPVQRLGPTVFQAFLASFVAAVVSQPFVNASELLRVRNDWDVTGMNKRYVTFLQTLKRVRQDVGYHAWLRGVRMAGVLFNATMLVCYEMTRDALVEKIHPEFDLDDDFGGVMSRITGRHMDEGMRERQFPSDYNDDEHLVLGAPHRTWIDEVKSDIRGAAARFGF